MSLNASRSSFSSAAKHAGDGPTTSASTLRPPSVDNHESSRGTASGALAAHAVFSSPSATSDLKTFQTALGIPDNDLSRFQVALGIPVPRPEDTVSPKNHGIYPSILHSERSSKYAYHFCDYFISLCLLLQIVVGACLTAFGASSVNHTVITIFGGVNTALAGIVALMKGQGLPNRLRQNWNGWRSLRDYIEEREREIIAGRPVANIWTEVDTVGHMYDAVRQTEENNRPDSYIVVPGRNNTTL
ncbi:MAG: hypothetical protein M1813_000977 [Trichoglossum hirsutum]|jgi:hypothetical protein|nr:MAG: hypothetical protein M1813_000977 [Trichoglossum hirsutum]